MPPRLLAIVDPMLRDPSLPVNFIRQPQRQGFSTQQYLFVSLSSKSEMGAHI